MYTMAAWQYAESRGGFAESRGSLGAVESTDHISSTTCREWLLSTVVSEKKIEDALHQKHQAKHNNHFLLKCLTARQLPYTHGSE